jgi:dolichol-phosphate mannosyltransferase
MDCDFSHDPADLPRLLEAADRAGIGLGSRYVRGGGTRNWGLVRRAVSRGGSVYARAILGIPVQDSTAGFKVYRRDVLEAIGPERIEAKGYAFQIETVYRAIRAGFGVEEVPILFADREEGGSKMGPGIVLEAMVRVPALRLAAARGRL